MKIEKMINASRKENSNNTLFKEQKKSCKIIFVEGYDDVIFYKQFFQRIFHDKMPKISCYEGKSKVLTACRKNNNPNYFYIVDNDYENLETIKKEAKNLFVTTGYSMENFFFYSNNDINYDNIKNFFKCFFDKYYDNINRSDLEIQLMKKQDEFRQELENYKNETILYYAYHRAFTYNDFSFPKKRFIGKNIKKEVDDFIAEIKTELDNYQPMQKDIIESNINDSLSTIKDNNYLWIRGHDIFDFLLDYLNNNLDLFKVNEITSKMVLECASGLQIPKEFKSILAF